jgi:hypothetical protein
MDVHTKDRNPIWKHGNEPVRSVILKFSGKLSRLPDSLLREYVLAYKRAHINKRAARSKV